MPRHCVQMAKISRHSLNLKGKATTMEKENHRNGGKQRCSSTRRKGGTAEPLQPSCLFFEGVEDKAGHRQSPTTLQFHMWGTLHRERKREGGELSHSTVWK